MVLMLVTYSNTKLTSSYLVKAIALIAVIILGKNAHGCRKKTNNGNIGIRKICILNGKIKQSTTSNIAKI